MYNNDYKCTHGYEKKILKKKQQKFKVHRSTTFLDSISESLTPNISNLNVFWSKTKKKCNFSVELTHLNFRGGLTITKHVCMFSSISDIYICMYYTSLNIMAYIQGT